MSAKVIDGKAIAARHDGFLAVFDPDKFSPAIALFDPCTSGPAKQVISALVLVGKYHAQRAAIRPARGDAQAVVVPKRPAGHRHGVTAGTQVGKRVGAHAGTGHALGLPVPGLFRPRPRSLQHC